MRSQWHITKRVVALVLILACHALAQDRYLVRIHSSAVASFAQNHKLTLLGSPDNPANPAVGSIGPLPGSVRDLYIATLATGSQAALTSIQNDPAVERVEANQKIGLPHGSTAASSSPWRAAGSSIASIASYFGTTAWSAYLNQPAAGIVRIPDAHQIATGAGTVAFIDTGVDFTNPVLAASLNLGWDFTNNTPGGWDFKPVQLNQSTTSILDSESMVVLDQSTTSILDQSTTSILDGQHVTGDYGHGTMIAGIIHLVAPTARLLPVKAFGDDGASDLGTILAAFYWAVDHGANVINMSFSMSDYSKEFSNALDYAVSQGVITVASTGNDGGQAMVYPAGYSQVMGVASTDNNNQRSSFSNYGNWVTVAAPGEGVISTYPGAQYAAGWGTSFSAPFVSGAAALLVQLNGNVNPNQAQKAISQASPAGQGLGAGVLNLLQACSYEAAHSR